MMPTLPLSIALLLAAAGGLGACYDEPVDPEVPTKELVAPSESAVRAAEAFRSGFGAPVRIFFSQNSGEILWLDAMGSPLAQGSIDDPIAAADTVRAFMSAHPGLYRVQNVRSEIVVKEHPVLGVTGFKKDPATGYATLRFEQAEGGIAVGGRYGIAFFDSGGHLLGLMTQIVPTAEGASSGSATGTSQQPLVLEPPAEPRSRTFARRYWLTDEPKAGAAQGSPTKRLVDEFLEPSPADPVQLKRILRDAYSGEIIAVYDETFSLLVTPPADWLDSGATERVRAYDTNSLTEPREILSTRSGNTLVLGFSLEGIHASGGFISITDAASVPEGGTAFGSPPIATDRSEWIDESVYNDTLRDATRFAQNLEATLRWFSSQLGWASWDGQGSELRTAIRGNRRQDGEPDVNAYASVNPVTGDAFILVGDGKTPTGQPLSDAPEVVAHEFSHTFIGLFTQLFARGESGALAESLADIFGMSVAGFGPESVYGHSAGLPSRNLLEPWHFGHPASYDDYLVIEEDRGGIHSNNGIMNRALALTILGFNDGTPGLGAVPVTGFLLRALQGVAYSQETKLEEFAAATSAFCRMLERDGNLPPHQLPLCGLLEKAFAETQLLAPAI